MISKVKQVLGSDAQFILGDTAVTYGALLAGCRFFAGYPITPATEIAEGMARLMPKVGGTCIQMEDEIASVGAIIGASWAGVKSMTATSGPGFSLMQENIGYACMTETPCVLVDVQRGGPSTGQPTRASQGDMMQARWGTHGDHEIIALVPNSVQETMELTIEAFNLSEQYRNPVLVMLDEIIGHMREKIVIPSKIKIVGREKTKMAKEKYLPFAGEKIPDFATFGSGYRVYATGLTHSETGLPSTDDPEVHSKLVTRICKKISDDREKLQNFKGRYLSDAEVVVLSYGSTSRSALTAVELARKKGIKAGYLRLITVWPFPEKLVENLNCSRILVAEQNLGQLVHLVRESARCEVQLCPKIGGEVHKPREILARLEE
jgi:2-oxoglutarate ferredoxin oxidoreductase subunit alpha